MARRDETMGDDLDSRGRLRPVTFGNPALGTYGGCVYTEQLGESELEHVVPSDATLVSRCVAMVDVPPEQCPEGILTFARSHRPYIEHVRILITAAIDATGKSPHTSKPLTSQFASAVSSTQTSRECIDSNSRCDRDASALMIDETSSHKNVEENRVSHESSAMDTQDEGNTLSRTYIILFQLSTEQAADVFVQDLHAKPYTSLDERQVGSVHHVRAVRGDDGVDLYHPFFAARLGRYPALSAESNNSDLFAHAGPDDESPPRRTASPLHAEVHNCAVCLEDMDVEQTSILTTVCNHSFHLDCLLQWQDSPCPVCRYDHSGLNDALSQCHVCGITESNYVCLICGVVSCGDSASRRRSTDATVLSHDTVASIAQLNAGQVVSPDQEYSEQTTNSDQMTPAQHHPMSHARQHYDKTLHAYALDTETQHVWDFCGQGYVHRLLQNAKDGKLVEVNDPNSTSQERTLSPGLSDAQEEEVVHRKLEGFATQYYTLLKSQLEQQRMFFEGRLEEVRREHGPNPRGKNSLSAAAELISALKQERNQLAQRCMSLRRRSEKVLEDVAFLRDMNESLIANKTQMRQQIADAQRSRAEARGMIHQCLPPLEEQVQALMLQLEERVDDQDGRKEQARLNQEPEAK